MPDHDPAVFDAERFRAEMGSVVLMRDLIALFPEETTAFLECAREATAAKDAEALHTAAHSLKGTIGNYYADHAHQAAATLDQLACTGDLTTAPEALEACEQAVQQLQAALEEFGGTLG